MHYVFSNCIMFFQTAKLYKINKSLYLSQLKFSGKLFGNESICHENYQLACKCLQLKSACKIHSRWFYNSTLHIKLVETGPIHKIFHPMDIQKALGVDNHQLHTFNYIPSGQLHTFLISNSPLNYAFSFLVVPCLYYVFYLLSSRLPSARPVTRD